MNKKQLQFEMEVRQNIKSGLLSLFKKYNLTQAQFAKDLGFNTKSVNNWLNCKSTIKIKSLLKICKFYNIKIKYFLGA
ncbi:MAG: helix-turn-helix transcriptional regulator, partial [Christensenellales bacterium]